MKVRAPTEKASSQRSNLNLIKSTEELRRPKKHGTEDNQSTPEGAWPSAPLTLHKCDFQGPVGVQPSSRDTCIPHQRARATHREPTSHTTREPTSQRAHATHLSARVTHQSAHIAHRAHVPHQRACIPHRAHVTHRVRIPHQRAPDTHRAHTAHQSPCHTPEGPHTQREPTHIAQQRAPDTHRARLQLLTSASTSAARRRHSGN